jgi:uncharacterized membrane protein (DUF106 family)
MLEAINDAVLRLGDILFGWMLVFPTDVIIFIVALGTALVLKGVRLLTTDQDFLRRCDEDKICLNRLIKEAKERGDKDAVRRHRAVKGTVALKSSRYEGKPLLAALLPIAVLGTWCFFRIAYHPTGADEPVEFVGYFPVSAAGTLVHMVPQDGLVAEGGWIREIEPQELTEAQEKHGLTPDGEARWTLRAKASEKPYSLNVRFDDASYEHKLMVGQKTYEPPLLFHDGSGMLCSQVLLREVKLFGLIPGFWGLPPWLIAYLVIAIAAFFVLKPILHIY